MTRPTLEVADILRAQGDHFLDFLVFFRCKLRLMPNQLSAVRCRCCVPRPLHPSSGDFQSSLVGIRRRARHLPLEGLCAQWQVQADDAGGIRVLTALLLTCAAQGIRPHSSLRISRESVPRPSHISVPTTADQAFLHAHRPCCLSSFRSRRLALPALRRNHGRPTKIHR